jgi:hypothetical protein
MTKANQDFNKEEVEKISKLGGKFRGVNEPLLEEADRCAQARKNRLKGKKKVKQLTVKALAVAYRTFLRCERDPENQDELMTALGANLSPKTCAKRLNTIVKAAVTNDRKYASKLAGVIRFAIHEDIAPDKLTEFVKNQGGIAKCITSWVSDDDDEEDEEEEKSAQKLILKIILANAHVQEGVDNLRAKAKRLDRKEILDAKLVFYPNGTVKLRPFEDEGADWDDSVPQK